MKKNYAVPTAFSLVEVLAAVALIGIITFLALPNIINIKKDGERSLAESRAEAINLAMAALVQARGSDAASAAWDATETDGAKYDLLKPYLAYAPESYSDFMPAGYSVTLPSALVPLSRVAITEAADSE